MTSDVAGSEFPQQQHHTELRKNVIALLLLALAIGLVLGRCASARFVGWDDNKDVSLNPDLNPPTAASLAKYWRRPQEGLYIPVVYSAWAALAWVARMPSADADGITLNPSVFHIANLTVHLLACFLVWQIVRRLLKNSPQRDWAAGAGALLFALHPLQVESVAWVTGFKDVCCGALVLAALLAHVIAAQTAAPGERSTARLLSAGSTVLYALALLSKPSAVCFPLMALVIDRRVLCRPWREMLPLILLWMGMAIGPALLARSSQLSLMPFRADVDLRVFVVLDSIGFYVEKLLLPFGLGIDHGRSPMLLVLNDVLRWSWIPGLIFCLFIWLSRRKIPELLAPALLFLAGLAPVLGFSPFVFQNISTVADRYSYLAMFGPALLLAALLACYPRPGLWMASSVVIAVLACISFSQAGYWHDNLMLMTRALEVNPNSEVALVGMGSNMRKAGQVFHASQLLRRALAIDPNDAVARFDYGNVLYDEHQVNAAIAQYEASIRDRPGDLRVLLNLGAALAISGRWEQSEKIFRMALDAGPRSAEAHAGLGRVLEQRGDFKGAMEQYEIALQLRPDLPQAQNGANRLLEMIRR